MKEWHKNLFLMTATLFLLLLVLEVAARLFMAPVSRSNFNPIPRALMTEADFPGVPYVFKPNASGVHPFGSNPNGYFDADATLTYQINSQGFRGREVAREKPAGTIRIAVVGDSFTFGSGVRDQHTLPAQLEQRLQEALPDHGIEVLNFGVSGYNTSHEIALLENAVLGFDPDIVVVVFFLNDTNARGTARGIGAITPEGSLSFIRKHLRLVDIIATRLEMQKGADALAEDYRQAFREDAPGWISSRQALARAVKLADAEDFKIILAIYPVLWKLSDAYPFLPIHHSISSYGNAIGLPVFDLQPAFRGYDGPELWAHPNNQHPNAAAHRIAAQALAGYLLKESPALLAARKP